MSDSPQNFYEFGPFRLDAMRSLLLRDGATVPLSPKVFETLAALVRHAGRVVRKEELIEQIWPNIFVEEGNLTQNIFVLRKALGEGPNDHRYIVTVPGHGYRFVARVREVRPPDDAASSVASVSRDNSRARDDDEANAVETVVASIAVLPFRHLGGDDHNGDKFLGSGIADALITRLSSVRQIAVRSTAAVLRYDDPARDPLAAGRELGVETVLDGCVQKSRERIRVTVQLVRLSDGKAIWAEKFDEKFTDVFTVQDSISEQVARALATRLTAEEHRQLTKRHTENAEAFQSYIRGRYFWNKRTVEGLQKAIEYARQAIAIDPAYALAYVGLADSYNLLPGHGGLAPEDCFPKAKAAALRALEIDDTLAEAHASLAFVNYRYDWDWKTAARNFRRAVELKPNYPTARHWHGESLVASGSFDDSLAELRRAQQLDPLSLPINTDLAQTLYFARRYTEAADQLRKTLEMDASFVRASVIYGAVLEQQGEYDEAIATLQRAAELSSGSTLALSGLGHAYALAGVETEARRVLDELNARAARGYVSSYNAAIIHAGLGEHERALELLARAFDTRDVWLVWLKVNPRFDSLRDDARFAEMMRRVGLT